MLRIKIYQLCNESEGLLMESEELNIALNKMDFGYSNNVNVVGELMEFNCSEITNKLSEFN